jgi:germination protein M
LPAKKAIMLVIMLLAMLVFLFALSGCVQSPVPVTEFSQGAGEGQEKLQEADLSANAKITAALYFANESGEKLVKEERSIETAKGDISVIILEELIKGPLTPGLNRTVPAGVKVLGVSVNNGIAAVDFSEEIRTRHWGGSTGEILTVYSIVNTLTELPEIEQVRFLIEGEEIETLTGHLDLSQPVYPDEGLIKN